MYTTLKLKPNFENTVVDWNLSLLLFFYMVNINKVELKLENLEWYQEYMYDSAYYSTHTLDFFNL